MSVQSKIRTSDVVYDQATGLLARLYIPETAPIGAVVDIHGGAWSAGDLLSNASIAEALAAAGILVMSIDFRKPPVAHYPASIADTHLAIRWLKAIAPSYGVASDRVGGIGTSSGGHQLLLAYLGRHDPRYAASNLPEVIEWDHDGKHSVVSGHQEATLAYLILCWPVADPLERYKLIAQGQGRQDLIDFHHAYWPDEAAMADGNPQQILEAAATGELPPTLIIQGTTDANLPAGSADRLAAAYSKAGGAASLSMFEDAVHGFITRFPDSDAGQEATKLIVDFAIEHSSG